MLVHTTSVLIGLIILLCTCTCTSVHGMVWLYMEVVYLFRSIGSTVYSAGLTMSFLSYLTTYSLIHVWLMVYKLYVAQTHAYTPVHL